MEQKHRNFILGGLVLVLVISLLVNFIYTRNTNRNMVANIQKYVATISDAIQSPEGTYAQIEIGGVLPNGSISYSCNDYSVGANTSCVKGYINPITGLKTTTQSVCPSPAYCSESCQCVPGEKPSYTSGSDLSNPVNNPICGDLIASNQLNLIAHADQIGCEVPVPVVNNLIIRGGFNTSLWGCSPDSCTKDYNDFCFNNGLGGCQLTSDMKGCYCDTGAAVDVSPVLDYLINQ